MNITIQNLSKSLGGNDILTDFSLEISSGMRLCVCGPNGSGKSTFLRLVAGMESPDTGRIILPRTCRMGFVEQELDEERLKTNLLDFVLDVLPDWNSFWEEWNESSHDEASLMRLSKKQAELENLYGYNPEHRAKAVLSGLGFSDDKLEKTLGELSGGWRERAKLARVLTAGSDLLLLDEPTNHLDLEAVEWLESFLLDYEGALLFVAHDRVFMDRVSTHILYFTGLEKPSFRRGNFTQFVELQGQVEEQKAQEAAQLQAEIEKKMDFVRRFKAKATKARQAASHQKMARRMERELEGIKFVPKMRELDFKWPEAPKSERNVLSVVDLKFSFPDGVKMWDKLSFTLYRGQKIALVGPNGCGKSTLLKLITGDLKRNSGQVSMGQQVSLGYFTQHQLETLAATGSVLGEIRRLSDPRMTEEELMSVLGLFLLGQEYFDRQVNTLSGGEKSRLILATLFLSKSNFLVLDEPTNHLDLESRQALVDALGEYTGTLLMVAHDRHLLSEVADQIWELTPSGFKIYERGYDEYNEARKKEKLQEATSPREDIAARTTGLTREEARQMRREEAEARNKLHREMKPLQDAYNKLEKNLEKVLEEQAVIEASLADPDIYNDGEKASKLLKNYHEIQEKSERLLEELSMAEEKLAPYEEKRLKLQDA